MSKTPVSSDFEVQKFETGEPRTKETHVSSLEPNPEEVAKHENNGEEGKKRNEQEEKGKIVDGFFANLTLCELMARDGGQDEQIGKNKFNISFGGIEVDRKPLENKEKASGYKGLKIELNKDLASVEKKMENIKCVFMVKSGDGKINTAQYVPATEVVKGLDAINKFIETQFNAGADKSKKEKEERQGQTKEIKVVVPRNEQKRDKPTDTGRKGNEARNNPEKLNMPAVEKGDISGNAGRQINMVVDGALGISGKGGDTGKTVNPDKSVANPKPLDKITEKAANPNK